MRPNKNGRPKAILAFSRIIAGWNAVDSVFSRQQFTSPVYQRQFAEQAFITTDVGELYGSDKASSKLYNFLVRAYPDEGEFLKELDDVSNYFAGRMETLEAQDRTWTDYQHLRCIVQSVNRVLNDMSSNKKKQIMVCLYSYELMRVCE